MKKSIISILLCIVIATALVGCGSSEEENTQQENTEEPKEESAKSELSEENFEIAQAVINVVDEYLNGDADVDTTYDAIQAEYEKITDKEDSNDSWFSEYTFSIENELFKIKIDDDGSIQNIMEQRNNIADLIGEEPWKEAELDYEALSEEEAEFIENLKDNDTDLYNDYMNIIDIMSCSTLNAFENNYDVQKLSSKDGGTDSSYYYIEQDLFGFSGQYEIWVSSNDESVMLVSYVPELSENSASQFTKYMELDNMITEFLGNDYQSEVNGQDVLSTWNTNVHVATISLSKYEHEDDSGMDVEITFVPNPNYDKINADFEFK